MNPWRILANPERSCILAKCNYVGYLVSRRSISGFILYVLGASVSWQSKSQKSVSLSSSEAEYIAISEAVNPPMENA